MTMAPSSRSASILLQCAVALCVAGCGGSAPPAAQPSATSSAGIDACKLLTAAEISSVTGIEAGDGTSPAVGVPVCHWPRTDREPPFDSFVQITVVPDSARAHDVWIAQMKSELEAMGSAFDAGDYPRVQGVGDWAVYLRDGGLLMVGRDGVLVQILVPGASDESQGVALARFALPRLPT